MTSLGSSASADQLRCHTLNTFCDTGFTNIGKLDNACRVFECGRIVDGKAEITAYINADGTCSFINQEMSCFTSLADCPHSYDNANNKIVVVRDTGLEFSSSVVLDSIDVSKDSTLGSVIIKDTLKVSNGLTTDSLRVSNGILQQSGDFLNLFKAPSSFVKLSAESFNCPKINGSSIYSSGSLLVDGESVLPIIKTSSIDVSGKGSFRTLSSQVIDNDQLHSKQVTIDDTLIVGNELSCSLFKSSKIITDDFVGFSGSLLSLKCKDIVVESISAKSITTDSLSVPSKLVFGTKTEPCVFNLNENKGIDIPIELGDAMRVYGYGYCPNQSNDTINIIVKSCLELSKVKVDTAFQYYDLNTSPSPQVFLMGSIVSPIDESSFSIVLKLSGRLPPVPYWLVDISLIPF